MAPSPPLSPRIAKLSCEVCGASTLHEHFGAQVCRACAAFFRRTVTLSNNYVCRRNNNCKIQPSARCVCRACRFRRCQEVGMRAADVQAREELKVRKQIKDTYLSRLETAYAKLQERRRRLHRSNREPRAISMRESEKLHITDVADIRDMLFSVFDEFALLPKDQEIRLYEQCYAPFNLFESCFHSLKSTNCDHLILPTGDFIDFFDKNTFIVNDDGVWNDNAEKLMKSCHTLFPQMKHNVQEPFNALNPDETEFLALASLQFWSRGVEGVTEETEQVIAKVQERLLSELLEHMGHKGVAEPGRRLSELLIFMAQLHRMMHRLQGLLALEKISDLYHMDEGLYRIFAGGI